MSSNQTNFFKCYKILCILLVREIALALGTNDGGLGIKYLPRFTECCCSV